MSYDAGNAVPNWLQEERYKNPRKFGDVTARPPKTPDAVPVGGSTPAVPIPAKTPDVSAALATGATNPNQSKAPTDVHADLSKATANGGQDALKDAYSGMGLDLSSSNERVKPQAAKVAMIGDAAKNTQASASQANPATSAKPDEKPAEAGTKPAEQAANPQTPSAEGQKPEAAGEKKPEQADASKTDKKDETKHKEGSLGDIKDKKNEILKAKKDEAQKALQADKDGAYNKLGEEAAHADKQLADLKSVPEDKRTPEQKQKIDYFEKQQKLIKGTQSKMVNDKATSLAEGDKSYQDLSTKEEVEKKKVDQYSDFNLKDENGKALSKEEISDRADLFDKDGKALTPEQLKEKGITKSYTEDAIKNDPMKVLQDKNASTQEMFAAFMVAQNQAGGANRGGAAPANPQDVAQQEMSKSALGRFAMGFQSGMGLGANMSGQMQQQQGYNPYWANWRPKAHS